MDVPLATALIRPNDDGETGAVKVELVDSSLRITLTGLQISVPLNDSGAMHPAGMIREAAHRSDASHAIANSPPVQAWFG